MLNRFTTAVVLAAIIFYQPMLFAAAALTANAERVVADASEYDRVAVIVRFEKQHKISELKEQHLKSEQYRSRKESRTLKRKQFR
ncbi:MAG: hypothetical protein AB2736_05985, partial [Candidatus Thiodiazotropha taylori]